MKEIIDESITNKENFLRHTMRRRIRGGGSDTTGREDIRS
jgi:hypothetical protein